MSYHYIKKYYGDDNYFPDSSWKRTQRYNASHGDTTIFNFGTCGYGTGLYSNSCYGGGSFWGGFGAGLGHGLANFACGILGGLFGGFMGGFGMPMFGMPMMFNNYGMVPNYVGFGNFNTTPSNTVTDSDTDKGRGGKKTETEKLVDKANNVDDKTKTDDIGKIISDIDKKLNDDKLSSTDKSSLEDSRKKLEAKKLVAELKSQPTKELKETDLELLIAQKVHLNDNQLESLKSALKTQLADLKIDGEDKYKCSRDYATLLKLELLGETVKAEHWHGSGDQYIQGPISHVAKLEDGRITYDIDCEPVGDCIKAKWTFEQAVDKKSCKPINAVPTASSCSFEFHDDVSYVWDEHFGYWVNTDISKPSASKKS